MELKLKLEKEYDVVPLFQFLYNKKKDCENDNHRHVDMISILEGNTNNKKAIDRLRYEKDRIKDNNDKIAFIDGLLRQLEPLVDKQLGK
jgi:hypothetical protein